MSNFTKKLKLLLEVSHIDFATLSKELSIGKNSMSYWENNGNLPKGETLSKIANYFNVPVEYFLGTGVFADWDNIVKYRERVIESLSDTMSFMSKKILDGVNDVVLVRLVQAFGVKLTIRDDGTCGVTMDIPVSTMPPEIKKSPLLATQQEEGTIKERLLNILFEFSNDEIEKIIEYAEFVMSQRK